MSNKSEMICFKVTPRWKKHIEKHIADETNETIDPLVALVEEIIDFLVLHPLTEYGAAHWRRSDNPLIYSPELESAG